MWQLNSYLSVYVCSSVTCYTTSQPTDPVTLTGGKGSFTQWVHCEFVVSFEAIRPVITQQVCGEFF